MPKSKETYDSEKIYRGYLEQIESALDRCMKGTYTLQDLQHIEEVIQKMCNMQEHAIFGVKHRIATYYHVISMLYASIGKKDLAFSVLQQAVKLADQDECVEEIYGKIYSDMGAYVEQSIDQLINGQKAIKVYEQLRKEGKNYSKNSYAMALFNTSVILMRFGKLKHAEHAYFIWKESYGENADEQIKLYMAEANKLMKFIREHMK